MKTINFDNLTQKAQKEINRFYKVDRFPTTILAQKKGRSFKLLFVPTNDMSLFCRQNDINEYSRVIEVR